MNYYCNTFCFRTLNDSLGLRKLKLMNSKLWLICFPQITPNHHSGMSSAKAAFNGVKKYRDFSSNQCGIGNLVHCKYATNYAINRIILLKSLCFYYVFTSFGVKPHFHSDPYKGHWSPSPPFFDHCPHLQLQILFAIRKSKAAEDSISS